MTAARWSLGAVGLLCGLYGAWLLWERQRPEQLVTVGTWWVSGAVLHDVALAAAVVVAGLVVTRLVPPVARAPVTVGAVVLGSTTLAAVPVLLAYGRRPDNTTLLDRDYVLGWCGLAAVVVAAVVVAVVVRVRGRSGDADGRRPTGDVHR